MCFNFRFWKEKLIHKLFKHLYLYLSLVLSFKLYHDELYHSRESHILFESCAIIARGIERRRSVGGRENWIPEFYEKFIERRQTRRVWSRINFHLSFLVPTQTYTKLGLYVPPSLSKLLSSLPKIPRRTLSIRRIFVARRMYEYLFVYLNVRVE